jgi:hypothetical protein
MAVAMLELLEPSKDILCIRPLEVACFFSQFVVDDLQVVLTDYTNLRLCRVDKSALRVILKIILVIFEGYEGFTLGNLFNSIGKVQVSCYSLGLVVNFAFGVDVGLFVF